MRQEIVVTYKLGDIKVEYCKYTTRTCPDIYYLLDFNGEDQKIKWAMVDNDILFTAIQSMFR